MLGWVRGGAKTPSFVVAIVVAASIIALPAHGAVAATDVVTNCSGSASTPGSLPYEVANATAGDTITFALSPPCSTIAISSTIEISQDLTISGPGSANLDVSGGGSVADFTVDSGVTATISGLSISSGEPGIFNNGSVSVIDSSVSNNSERGILNAGSLTTVVGSTISNNM